MSKTKSTLINPETGEQLVDDRARVWACIIYPGDSCPNDWQDYLANLIVPIAVSPLHTGELLSTGDFEKDHRHVILDFAGVKSQSQVKSITQYLQGTIPVPVADIRAYTRYLIHLDQPQKKQYDRSDIITYSGYDLETCILPSKGYLIKMCQAMEQFCDDNNILEYADLTCYCRQNEPAWYDILINERSSHFKTYLQSRRNSLKLSNEMEQQRKKIDDLIKYVERLTGVKYDG